MVNALISGPYGISSKVVYISEKSNLRTGQEYTGCAYLIGRLIMGNVYLIILVFSTDKRTSFLDYRLNTLCLKLVKMRPIQCTNEH